MQGQVEVTQESWTNTIIFAIILLIVCCCSSICSSISSGLGYKWAYPATSSSETKTVT